jgi:hypothetical protein
MKAHLKLMNATLALALAAGAMTAMSAAPAGAAAANSCAKVSGTATFSPGVTTTAKNQTIKSKGTETGCTPTKATGGSGTLTATIPSKAATCAKLLKGGQTLKGVAKSVWKNKKSTNFAITLKTGTGSKYNIATITGTATAGLFKGKSIAGQIKFTVKAGQSCTPASPVKNLTFASTKPFVMK